MGSGCFDSTNQDRASVGGRCGFLSFCRLSRLVHKYGLTTHWIIERPLGYFTNYLVETSPGDFTQSAFSIGKQ